MGTVSSSSEKELWAVLSTFSEADLGRSLSSLLTTGASEVVGRGAPHHKNRCMRQKLGDDLHYCFKTVYNSHILLKTVYNSHILLSVDPALRHYNLTVKCKNTKGAILHPVF